MTKAQLVTGVVGTAAASRTQIGGNITLPAGGPWLIHGIWSQVVQDTAVANESINGNLIIDSLSGDINPDPAPGRYPAPGMSSQSSANFGIHGVPLNIWPVRWEAAGKAVLTMSFENLSGNASAPVAAAGIIFGDSIPEAAPLTFCDGVGATLTLAAEAAIGTITLAEKAQRIVGVCATARKDGQVVVDECMLAHIRLDSADINFSPAQFPCDMAWNAADGVLAGGSGSSRTDFIPVDIPVIGGSIINVFGTLVNAVTNGLDVSVYLAYE